MKISLKILLSTGVLMAARKEQLLADFTKNGLPKPETVTMKVPSAKQRKAA